MSAEHDARAQRLAEAFARRFGRTAEGLSEAPGRVNLIGEHVDYNDGLVLPFAIDRSVLCAWARRDDDRVCAYSTDLDDRAEFGLSEPADGQRVGWAAYVRGVACALIDGGYSLRGIDLAIAGDVPLGAGLSSSAALEVAVAGALRDASALKLTPEALALACQRAEREFVGVQCGIMDQFASALAHRDAALLIDCRSLAHRDVSLPLASAGFTIIIADSGTRRELASSAYNDRPRECAEVVGLLREALGRGDLTSLRDVGAGEIEQLRIRREDVALRRARHVVTEIARVAAAVDALDRQAFGELGELMVESHLSLRDDFEVSTPELDLLVALATAQSYVLGARLTGAGFGGCTVNLVRAGAVEAFEREVIGPYRERSGRAAVIYVTGAHDGLRTWRLQS